MSYYVKQPHKCTQCGYEMGYSSDECPDMILSNNGPYCPVCLSNFLTKHVGTLLSTSDFTGKGSPYDREMKP